MKKISFKKAIVILLMIIAVTSLAIFVIVKLNEEPAPPQEVVLPEPSDKPEDKPYGDSLVERQDEDSRESEFDYNIKISVEEQKKVYELENMDWVTAEHESIKLTDGTSLYVNEYVVTSGYNISENGNGLTIQTNFGDYVLEIVKINNTPFEYVYGKDNYNEENELINEYDKIMEEYNTIYQESDTQSSLEYGGVGTYKKLQDFIESNNLQKDIGLYTADQVKEVCEKVFNVTLSDEFVPIQFNMMYESDIYSYRYDKMTSNETNETFSNKESYYLMSNGANVYACHLISESYVPSEKDFNDVIKYVTISTQLY